LLSELAYIDEETFGLQAVTKRHAADTNKVDLEIPEVLWDMNTPGDYERALADQAQPGSS
jgi:hypothetical protein